MATVRPYVAAVKRVPLHIVSYSNNWADSFLRNLFPQGWSGRNNFKFRGSSFEFRVLESHEVQLAYFVFRWGWRLPPTSRRSKLISEGRARQRLLVRLRYGGETHRTAT